MPSQPDHRLSNDSVWTRFKTQLRHPDRVATAVELSRTLIGRSGEAKGTSSATALANLYRSMSDAEARAYFSRLVEDFGPSPDRLTLAAHSYLQNSNPANASALHLAAEPVRQELLRRLNMASGGTSLLVTMRERVLSLELEHPKLRPLALDLKHLLSSWFNRGFLQLRQLDWYSSAAILEKLIRYEAVHEIAGWDDLRWRISGNRRCFGFFHPALEDEPLIFVEVALTDCISNNVDALLENNGRNLPLKAPTTAVFYSISNCQDGLRGVALGNFLIKQLVSDLQTELRSLRTFVTLSPVPGFRSWLTEAVDMATLVPRSLGEKLHVHSADPLLHDELNVPLSRLCARYLTGQRPDGSWGAPTDPVARFHLSNGARLERINWKANSSPKGVRESFGLMVNYRYFPSCIERNQERFATSRKVAKSPVIAAMTQLPVNSWLPH
jgi:malonyl-CoA decarboxylase